MSPGWTTPLIVGLALLGIARGEDDAPLMPRASASPGPYFVGQAIEVRVALIAGAGKPTATSPRVAGAEVAPAELSWSPIATDGIGEVVHETRRYLFKFQVVAKRPGTLTFPPIVVRLGGRSGRTRAVPVEVRAIPSVGRPSTFLGGVGDLKVEASARPSAVRVGQSLVYEIRLTGPGAWGSSRPPTLSGGVFESLRIRVEPLPEDTATDPPSRTFRYRLRPAVAGEASLPPVAVSTFQPKSERFLTWLAPAVPIRVAAVSAFDPSRLDYGEPAKGSPKTPRRWALAWAVALIVPLALLLARRALVRRRDDPRRLARRLALGFPADSGAEPLARRITEDLAEYLRAAIGRPPGALTPEEARREVERAGGDAGLGGRAGRLVACCDRARYRGGDEEAGRLAGEARAVFLALGMVRVGKRDGGGKTEGGTLDR